jgi:hypothetical protein
MPDSPRMRDPVEPQAFLSLEEWMLARLRGRTEAQVLTILRLLPEAIKNKYRKLWEQERKK